MRRLEFVLELISQHVEEMYQYKPFLGCFEPLDQYVCIALVQILKFFTEYWGRQGPMTEKTFLDFATVRSCGAATNHHLQRHMKGSEHLIYAWNCW